MTFPIPSFLLPITSYYMANFVPIQEIWMEHFWIYSRCIDERMEKWREYYFWMDDDMINLGRRLLRQSKSFFSSELSLRNSVKNRMALGIFEYRIASKLNLPFSRQFSLIKLAYLWCFCPLSKSKIDWRILISNWSQNCHILC